MQQVFYSEQQVLNCFQAKMPRSFTQTAAVLRAKECVLKTATTIQENAEDIYAEAQQINEDRAAKDAEEYTDVEDVETAAEAEEAETAAEENEAE